MLPTPLLQLLKACLRELQLHKVSVVLCFAIVSLAVLIIGLNFPKTYTSSALLYANQDNIIEPLLEDKAAITQVDHAKIAQDQIHSRRILEPVAREAGLIDKDTSPKRVASVIGELSAAIELENSSENYINLSFSSPSPDKSFNVASALVERFITYSAESQRKESKDAFLFIDSQVKSYKTQLLNAEKNLKQFRASNRDGTQESVDREIDRLRDKIQQMTLDLDELKTRKDFLKGQVKDEGQLVAQRYNNDENRERLSAARSKLDGLLLSYTETHPDVVHLREQIKDLKSSISNSKVKSMSSLARSSDGQKSIDPLYDKLRGNLADATVEIRTLEKRLAAHERLLSQQYERAKRVAERQAERSELTRDYNVTKNIYEDMLERKEKARLSMTLDLEGRGVSYKVQEPPIYPTLPKGLRFTHFAMAGPVLGIAIPLGLIFLFIQLDPRIRMSHLLEDSLPVPLMGVVPHLIPPMRKRLFSKDIVMLSMVVLAVIGIYAAAAWSKINGVQ